MDRGPVWRVLLALSLLDMGSGGSGWVYEVHMERVNFDKAAEGCSGGGGLAELPAQQEVSEALLRLEGELRGSSEPQTFWVGLRKGSDRCVIPHLPLRGFSWRSDGGQGWAGPGRWWEEPAETCIGRCVALKAQANGTGLGRWGLLARPCRDNLAFICKRTGGPADPPLTSPAGTEPRTTRAPGAPATAGSTLTPATLSAIIATPATTPGPGPGPVSSAKPEPTPKSGAEPRPQPGAGRDPQPESKPKPGPGPPPAKAPCPMPNLPWARSLRPEPGDPAVLTLECWSGTQPRVHCSDGRWEYLGSALDPAVVCPVSRSRAPPSPPPPPPPSPSPSEEGGWGGVMVLVLVAVAVLVVLVVLAGVVVWCCLGRRSVDRAVRKAKKMAMEDKEAGGKDSMETANEKERR